MPEGTGANWKSSQYLKPEQFEQKNSIELNSTPENE